MVSGTKKAVLEHLGALEFIKWTYCGIRFGSFLALQPR